MYSAFKQQLQQLENKPEQRQERKHNNQGFQQRIFASVEQFGVTKDGRPVKIFKLRDVKSGCEAGFIEFGAAVQSLIVPDSQGRLEDVVLGFDSVEQYEENKAYQGVVIGRCAGRIRQGHFSVNGVKYQASQNNGEHHLHGGFRGIHKLLWKGCILLNGEHPAVQFECTSPPMDEGFPGEAKFRIVYTLIPDAESNRKCTLRMEFEAATDKSCPISPDTHVLFNLNGESKAQHALILNHLFRINSERVTDQGADFVPTGHFNSVRGQYDFRQLRHAHLVESNGFGGYAHAFENPSAPKEAISSTMGHSSIEVAEAFVPENGRRMVVRTDAPTTVFYTGHGLDGTPGKHRKIYRKYSGFLFICEHSPNAVNLQSYSGFTDPILRPGKKFSRLIEYEFSA